MNTKTKQIVVTATALFLVTAAGVMAATWRGTGSIQQGAVVDPAVIKQNFDYLYERINELENASVSTENMVFRTANVGEDEYGSWSATFGGTTRWWGVNTHADDTCDQYHRTAYTCPVNASKTRCKDIMQVSGANNWKQRYVTCKKASVPYILED